MFPRLLFISSVISLFTFSDCKKGVDDPFISLRTRKARLTGDWKMSSGSLKRTDTRFNSTYWVSFSTDYDGSTYKTTTTNKSGIYETKQGTYSLRIIFKKDGGFEMTEETDGNTVVSKGNWNFSGGVGNNKKKEQVILNFHSKENNGQNNIFKGTAETRILSIKELRNKKLVLTFEDYYKTTSASGYSDSSSQNEEYILRQ